MRPPPNMADIKCERSLNVKQSSLPGLCSCVAWLCPILPGTSGASAQGRNRLIYNRDLSSAVREDLAIVTTVVSALAMAVTRCPCTLSPYLWELACCTHLAWVEETDFDLKGAPEGQSLPALPCPLILTLHCPLNTNCTVNCQHTALSTVHTMHCSLSSAHTIHCPLITHCNVHCPAPTAAVV